LDCHRHPVDMWHLPPRDESPVPPLLVPEGGHHDQTVIPSPLPFPSPSLFCSRRGGPCFELKSLPSVRPFVRPSWLPACLSSPLPS
jgi:hypothetical protein